MTTRFLTVGQVCDLLQLSEVSVRRKIRDGTIPAIRLATEGRGRDPSPRRRARPLARTPARPAGRHVCRVHAEHPRKERPITDRR
jgi:excisionase family DNA binding protein